MSSSSETGVLSSDLSASGRVLPKVVGTPGGRKRIDSLLNTFRARDLALLQASLASVRDSTTVGETLALLSSRRILSVPVRRLRGTPSERGYFAFVDMLDILGHFVRVFGDDFADCRDADAARDVFDKKRDQFLLAPVASVANLSGRNAFCPVQEDAPLRGLIDVFAAHTVHRVPLVSGTGDVTAIVTQSAVVQWIADRSDKLRAFFPVETVGELALGYRPVVTVSLAQRAYDAFRLIHSHGVSGVAVVDDAGALVGVVSASDLRLVQGADGAEHFAEQLMLPVADFLEEIRASQSDRIPKLATVSPDMTLEQVFEKFAVIPVHRLFIVDADNTLKGLLSLGDVLAALLLH